MSGNLANTLLYLAIVCLMVGIPYDSWRRGEQHWWLWAVLSVGLVPMAVIVYGWYRFWRWHDARRTQATHVG